MYGSLGDAADVASAIEDITTDPYLPEVASLIVQIHNLQGASTGATSATATAQSVGVGLQNAVVPLQLYIQFLQNPTLGYLTIGAVLAIPFMLGYLLGK